jgi:uncharacterized protein (TIGR02284 family)
MADRDERAALNELIIACRDAARGFEWAAEHVHDPELQALFKKIAVERHQYVMDLLPHAWWLGTIPQGDGSRAAALHRAWMAVRDRLAHDHDRAILEEAERGERAALVTYAGAVEGMPSPARTLVEAQHAAMQATYERLQTLAAVARR